MRAIFSGILFILLSFSALAQAPVSSTGPTTDRAISIWSGAGGDAIQDSPLSVSTVGALQTKTDGVASDVLYFPSGFQHTSMFNGNGGHNLVHFSGLEGYYIMCSGMRAGTHMTTASYNVCMGFETMESCETCSYEVGIGEAVLIYDKTGIGNSVRGLKAAMGTPGHNFGSYNDVDGYFALSALAIPGPPAAKIIAASWAGGVVTFGTDTPHAIVAGNTVTVTGVTPPSYNQVYTVASVPDPTHITVPLPADPGAYARAGYIDVGLLRNFNVAKGAWAMSNSAYDGSYGIGMGFNAMPDYKHGNDNICIASINACQGIENGSGNIIIGKCPPLPANTSNQIMICNGAGTIVFRNP